MSRIDFTGRVAIITGGGGGLGKNYAIELAKRGAKVVVNDLGGSREGVGSDSAPADRVVEEIRAMGGEAVPNYDNVANQVGGDHIVQTAVNAFGKVDILINNAGILLDSTFVKMDEKKWDAVVAIHLKGTYCVTKPAFLHMMKQGYGRIIMTTSGSALFGNFGQTNYASAKMGVVGFANVLKLEGEKYNIKTNVIVPIAGTRLTEDIVPPEIFARMKVDFVTPAVLYMCSEQCQDSGLIINAGLGYFSRSAIMTGEGVILSDGNKIPTPEEVMENWGRVASLKNPRFFSNLEEMSRILKS
ncbi:MAG: SDR family oxidoreductase [Syntrophaceae bacterium]|nr:SDR family oxidoreductase [Syntrophaceae bacterium]